ncbi:MAG TPA: hypothetical protein VNS79_02700 [Sphingobium sp.]|nr:hypothetical protein [Sphingobium sp.]
MSFGNYLTLTDAVRRIGVSAIDVQQLATDRSVATNVAAWDRADSARMRLKHWLIGGRLRAFGQDDEGAYTVLGPDRLSKPFFDIDVVRSLFRWAPNDWAVIYVARDMLDELIASIGNGTPRKEITYKWDDVASIAWKAALDAPPPRRRAALITQIQLEYSEAHACEPGEKEVGRVLDDILGHIGDRVLSREVSPE